MPDLKDSQLFDNTSNNLPIQLTSFVGREREIETLTRLLLETRLLTLTGAGGTGKTRLCLKVAAQVLEDFKDGVWLVELGSIFEPQLVVHKVSSTLGCRGEAAKSMMDTLKQYLHQKVSLLVMDNCEHLVQACADLVAGLLLACPNLRVMATSREPLGVPGETVYEVSPLSIPDLEHPMDHDRIVHSEAVQLFIERAQAFQPTFQVDNVTARAIAQICLLLDGIPLAIELASARVRVLGPPQIADHLKDSMNLLTSVGRTVVARQQTLQACIDWSYALLNEREQILFRRLGVFAGSFIIEDVEAVCAGDNAPGDRLDAASGSGDFQVSLPVMDSADILETLSNLVDKSLVRVVPGLEVNYRMLNPIQRFAWKKLKQSAELEQLRNRHLNYYFNLVKQVHPIIRRADLSLWVKKIELELDNFRAALDWSLPSGALETGLGLAYALGNFWWFQGYSSEGLEWFKRLLASYHPQDVIRAKSLVQAGLLSLESGDYEEATALSEDSLRLSRELEYQAGIADALCLLGVKANCVGDCEKSLGLLVEGLAIYRQLGDDWNVASKQLFLGDVQWKVGNQQQAYKTFNESLKIFKRLNCEWGMAWAMEGFGNLARLKGDYEQALTFLWEALEITIKIGEKLGIAFRLEYLAITLVELKQYRRAANLWGFAQAWRESIHSLLPPSYKRDYAPFIQAAHSVLGDREFEVAWEEGRGMTLDQATALVMQPSPGGMEVHLHPDTPGASSSILPEAAEQYGLTKREVEVLRLVARGLTDAQVGEELFISPRTVSKHLQSIYGKIQVNSRSAATRFAIEHGIA